MASIVAYRLYEMLGAPYYVSCEPINLYINGEYRGVYYLTNKVAVGKSYIDIPEFSNEGDTDELTQVRSDRGIDDNLAHGEDYIKNGEVDNNDIAIASGIQAYQYATHSSGTAKNGGYLTELDELAHKDSCYFVTSHNHAYAVLSPENATQEQVQKIAIYVEEFEQALYDASGYNLQGHYYVDYIDVSSIAKKVLIDMVSCEADRFRRSRFLYNGL